MVINILHRLIDALLRVDRRHVLNWECDGEAPQAEIAAELRTIGDQLKKKIEMFKTVMTDFNAILDEYEIKKKTI